MPPRPAFPPESPALRHAAPFPWAQLASLRRADVTATRTLRRLAARLEVHEVESALGALVKGRIEIRVVRCAEAEARGLADDAVGIVLAPVGERSPSRRVLVELEGALSVVLCARALGHTAPVLTDASRLPSPPIAGACGAIVHAALRRATRGAALRVLSAGPSAALTRDVLRSASEATSGAMSAATAWLSISVDGAAFAARVTVTDGLSMEPEPPMDLAALARLGDLPLALSVVAGQTTLPRREALALTPGDVLLPGLPDLPSLASGHGGGRVALVAPRSERGVACDLTDGDRLVLRGELAQHPWSARAPEETPGEDETAMTESTTQTSLASLALEDAPVVVRVEVGVVEMTARAWSELGPGDVIALGRRAGEPVVLRTAGVEIARGELVQIDGEIGVRILPRSGGST